MYTARTSVAPNMTEQFMGIAKFVQSFRFELFLIHPILHTQCTIGIFNCAYLQYMYACFIMLNICKIREFFYPLFVDFSNL